MNRLFLIIATIVCLMISLPLANAENPEDPYSVGVGDVISIDVINEPGLRTSSSIAADGTINFPYLGTVYIKDMTVAEIKDEITKKLSDEYIKYPVVSVTLSKSLSRKIFILGAVGRPGMLRYEGDESLLKALSQAGGVTRDGLYGRIKIRRKEEGKTGGYKDLVESSLNEGIIEDKDVEDTLLQADDIVVVERNEIFLMKGEVSNRGKFVIERDITLLKALSQAGGVTQDGLYGRIKIRRKEEGKTGGYKDLVESSLNEGIIEDKDVEDTLLQADDIVVVERNETFLIYGEVNRPGEYVLKGNMTVLKGITLAGGFSKWGSPDRVKVLRTIDSEPGHITIKVALGFVIEGDMSADIILKSGDIVIVSSGIF